MSKMGEILDEAKHLRALGRIPVGEITPQEDLVARMLEPSAWSTHADEHINHATRYRTMGASNHFGTMFRDMRDIAVVRAREIVEALERQAAGLPPLVRFEARRDGDALAKRLGIKYDYQKRAGLGRNVVNVGFLRGLDGLVMPDIEAEVEDVVLAWDVDGRRSTARLHGDYRISGDVEPRPDGFEPWEESVFSKDVPTRVSDMLRLRSGKTARKAKQSQAA